MKGFKKNLDFNLKLKFKNLILKSESILKSELTLFTLNLMLKCYFTPDNFLPSPTFIIFTCHFWILFNIKIVHVNVFCSHLWIGPLTSPTLELCRI